MEKGVWGAKYLRNNSGQVVGIDMGFYGCAEHEYGILGLTKAFGIDLGGQITEVPRNVYVGNIGLYSPLVQSEQESIPFNYLVFDFQMGKKIEVVNGKVGYVEKSLEEKQKYLERKLFNYTYGERPLKSEDFLFTAWDKESFLVLANQHNDFYKRLEDAFLENDIMIAQHPKFSPNSRLVIGMYSELFKIK